MCVVLQRAEVTAAVAQAKERVDQGGQGWMAPRWAGSAVLAVGCNAGLTTQVGALFEGRGQVLIQCRRLIDVQSRQWFSRRWVPHRLSHLVVDVAALGGLGRCLPDLRRIKDLMPDLPLLLIDDGQLDTDRLDRRLFPRGGGACEANLRHFGS